MDNSINKASKFVSWFFYFLIYTFGYLSYTAWIQTQGLIFRDGNFFTNLLIYGLSFDMIILIVVSAYISSQAMTRKFSRIIFMTVIGTIAITIYKTFSHYYFFLRLNQQVLLIFCILLLSGVVGYLFNLLYRKNAMAGKLLALMVLIIVVVGGGIMILLAPNYYVTSQRCNSFSDHNKRLPCFYKLGIKDSNLDYCLEVSSEMMSPGGPECVRKALTNLEQNNKLNTSLCETWTNSEARSLCYYKIAIIENNKVLCSKVADIYTDENMSLVEQKSGIIMPGMMEIPNKQTCLLKIQK